LGFAVISVLLATLFLFVGLQLFYPRNHGGGDKNKNKIKSQYMLFLAYNDVMHDAIF
jgi:hypothetical protein